MTAVVIDTNVLLVANGTHENASYTCQQACIDKLSLIKELGGVVVLDDTYEILSEYQNKTAPNQPKGVGDVFLKYLLQNQANTKRVQYAKITPLGNSLYAEFPLTNLQEKFDPADRKFVAVSNAYPNKPNILQAVDCKWLDWAQDLARENIEVEFLCPADVCEFYKQKFPKNLTPKLCE